jgi:hypothetical protein
MMIAGVHPLQSGDLPLWMPGALRQEQQPSGPGLRHQRSAGFVRLRRRPAAAGADGRVTGSRRPDVRPERAAGGRSAAAFQPAARTSPASGPPAGPSGSPAASTGSSADYSSCPTGKHVTRFNALSIGRRNKCVIVRLKGDTRGL